MDAIPDDSSWLTEHEDLTTISGHIEVNKARSQEPVNWQALVLLHALSWKVVFWTKFFGVRLHSGIRPVAAKRGIPRDASMDTLMDYFSGEGEASWAYHWGEYRPGFNPLAEGILRHSASWVLAAEIYEVVDRAVPIEWLDSETWGTLLRRSVPQVLDMLRFLASEYGPTNVRLVVWFEC